jgi:hypothetical protein
VDALGDLLQQGGGNFLVGWVLLEVDGNEKLLGLLVDISNVDTTFVGEEDPVALRRSVSSEVDMIGGRSRARAGASARAAR